MLRRDSPDNAAARFPVKCGHARFVAPVADAFGSREQPGAAWFPPPLRGPPPGAAAGRGGCLFQPLFLLVRFVPLVRVVSLTPVSPTPAS